MSGPEPSLIIYDGQCIFCQNYMRMLRLVESVGKVDLVDARSDDPRVREMQHAGFDLNEGMIFRHRGDVHYGADAVHALALLSSSSSTFNRLNAKLLSNRSTAARVYPWLKRGRRLMLSLLGRSTIAAGNSNRGASNRSAGQDIRR